MPGSFPALGLIQKKGLVERGSAPPAVVNSPKEWIWCRPVVQVFTLMNRELAFGTAFDLRLAATRCVLLNLAFFWGTGIERRLSE